MKISEKLRQKIKNAEGLGPKYAKTGRIVAYLCPAGKPTIGWGHTKGVSHLDIGVREISKEQAESLLSGDLHESEQYVTNLKLDITQEQFDTLVSAAMNVGSFGETLRANLKAKDWKAAATTLKRYIHGNGPKSVPCKGACGVKGCSMRMYPGLVTRRAEEAKALIAGAKKGA